MFGLLVGVVVAGGGSEGALGAFVADAIRCSVIASLVAWPAFSVVLCADDLFLAASCAIALASLT